MFLYAHGHQIFGDPDAADIVFTSGADVLAVGINVTHQVVLTGTTLGNLCSLIIVTLVFMYKKTYYHYIYICAFLISICHHICAFEVGTLNIRDQYMTSGLQLVNNLI